MKLLDNRNYYKLIEPLAQVTINHLFARAVIEYGMPGSVFVDDLDNPKTYYVRHPYGMGLLFGDSTNKIFNKAFKEYALNLNNTRDSFEWVQAFSVSWNTVLSDLFGAELLKSSENTSKKEIGIIELNTRVNFKFNRDSYVVQSTKNESGDIHIVRADRQIFRDMKGSVIPFYFWKNEDDFVENGIGFSLFYKGHLASTVYSAFIQGKQLEIGIETIEPYRGMGFAEQVCMSIIDYCIKNDYEPIWACRLENSSSYKLAQKLGFIPSLEIPCYRLSR